MWTCPKCKRLFKRKDQQHSCVLITTESLFDKRPSELKKLYDRISKEVKKFGDCREETVKLDTILFKTKSSFLGIKVKKDHLVIEYFLDHLEDVPPVFKYLQTSRNRVVHYVAISDREDINQQLIRWMKQSYDLISK